MPEFSPEQFTLITDFDEFRLDKDIAAEVANAVYARNNPRKDRPNSASIPAESPFIIDATHNGYSWRPGQETHEENDDDEDSLQGLRVHIPEADFASITGTSNAAFAYGLQRLLDAGERDNRMSIAGSLILGSSLFGIMAGPTLADLALGMPKGNEGLLSISAVLAGLFGGTLLPTTAQNIKRRMVTNPEGRIINRRHMINTLKYVGQLGLKPMLSDTEQQLNLLDDNYAPTIRAS